MSRILLALILAVPLFAQRFDEAITVNVIEVPVYVERFGEPVRGLTRDDFELFVNGQRHPIEYFDVLDDAGRPSARRAEERRVEARPAPELKRRRLVVLLFDLGASSPYALQRAREAAIGSLADGDAYAVATIGRRGVRFVVPFTTDAVALRRAIGTLAPSDARDPLGIATLDRERTTWRGAEAGSGEFGDIWGTESRGGFADSVAVATSQESYEAAAAWEASEREMHERRFSDELAALADRLAPMQGIKHVVLFSERRNLDTDRTPFASAKRVHQHFHAAGVILDGVDIRPPFAPGAQGGRWTPRPAGQLETLTSPFLHTLAGETGGAVATSLKKLQKRNGVTYVLAFRTSGKQKDANRIEVRVKNQPKLTEVRSRPAYATGGGGKSGENGLLLADTLLNDIPQRGITLDLAVEGTSVAAKIPGAELLANVSTGPLLLDVYFYVFDGRGQAAGWNYARVAVDLDKGREFLSAHPYTIRQSFELPSGSYAAKTLVRVVGTDKTGFARADFLVP